MVNKHLYFPAFDVLMPPVFTVNIVLKSPFATLLSVAIAYESPAASGVDDESA